MFKMSETNLRIQNFFEILAELFQDKNIQACAVNSVKGGLLAGFSTTIGGLLLGPPGLALGGIIGGLTALVSSKKFQSVAVILKNMSLEKKKVLYHKIKDAIKNYGIQDLTYIGALILSNNSLQNIAMEATKQFLSQEFNLKILN